MERNKVVSLLKEKCDLLGEFTPFRNIVDKFVSNIVESGSWFSFSKTDNGQVNILSINNNSGDTLGHMISENYELTAYREACMKYLLHDYLCYYEAPIVKKGETPTGTKNSFNKYLVTSNIGVIAEWLDCSYEDAEQLYGQRLLYSDVDNGEHTYPYVKLYATKEGIHKITKPRSDMDLSIAGLKIVPVFALKTGVDLLYNKLKSGSYDVTFLKDSGQKRVISTTFSKEVALQYYEGYEKFINENYDSVYNGDFLNNSTLERGYIRVFELGSSVYNYPLRSINYARIIKIEEATPDMSYITMDLDGALDCFINSIYSKSFVGVDIEEVVDLLDVFEVGESREVFNVRIETFNQLENWAKQQNMLYSTVFIRQLATFMVGNPEWFPEFSSGNWEKPKSSQSSEESTEEASSFNDNGELPLEFDMPFV